MPNTYTTEIACEQLMLFAEGAAYWPRQHMLLIADLHWGKSASFRAAGLAIPEGSTARDLERISNLIERTGARRLMLLGDLLHANAARSETVLSQVATWREYHSELEITLVRGNHDRRAGDPPEDWRFSCVNEPLYHSPFSFCHYPQHIPGSYCLAGHVHPAVELRSNRRQRLRLPCFWFGADQGILPAFGSFTGSSLIRAASGDQVFVLADGEVLRVQ